MSRIDRLCSRTGEVARHCSRTGRSPGTGGKCGCEGAEGRGRRRWGLGEGLRVMCRETLAKPCLGLEPNFELREPPRSASLSLQTAG